jgi:choline-sulfatase
VTPTLLAWVGAEDQSPTDLPGRSLLDVSRLDAGRPVFSEYHANWSIDGTFMLRDGRYKYIEHIGAPPQLFDVLADPAECNDLARDGANAGLLTEYRARIREHFDPDEVDARAKADQDRRVAAVGGIDEALARTVNFTPTP